MRLASCHKQIWKDGLDVGELLMTTIVQFLPIVCCLNIVISCFFSSKCGGILTHSFHKFFTKILCMSCTGFLFLTKWQKFAKRKKAGYIICTRLNMVVNERISLKFKSLNWLISGDLTSNRWWNATLNKELV
jgi:hypothetical protein